MKSTSKDWPPAVVTAARLVTFAIICGVLFWGQVVLMPIALAALVTFLMSPLVTRLDRWGLPRVAAVIIVAGSVTGILGGLGYVVVGELGELAAELPAHRENIRAKISDLRALTRGGTIENVQRTIEDISRDVEQDAESEAGSAAAPQTPGNDEEEPVRVAIETERQLLGDAEMLGPVFQAAATGGLTMLLSIFMLIKREDLRNRLVSLAGQTSLVVTTKAFAEAGERISRYLLMQFIINATMGIAVGTGLFLIGVPYAALWGLSAAVLRYIPYVGPWVAALLPIAVSIVTAPGWEQVALVIALFLVLELLSNNVMEPWLYGQSVGLSSIAVIVSAIFWTWIWGPVGLVIATPITACIVVLSRYVPEMSLFDRLLSERPALQPHLSLYQRLLARDEDEAEDIVDEHLARTSLIETCDALLLGTLLALKRDLAAGRVSQEDGEFVQSALREIVDDLPHEEPPDGEAIEPRRTGSVLLIGFPVRDPLDEIVLLLVAATLRHEPCRLEILSADMLIGERIADVEARKPAAVCVPSLPPGDLTVTRHACKRLRTRLPGLKIVVGRFGVRGRTERSNKLLKASGANRVEDNIVDLHDVLRRIARDAWQAASAQERTADVEGQDARPAEGAEGTPEKPEYGGTKLAPAR
ncbi:MAG: AI-2E family transporter [Gammaproteobacteria bacterium]|nr:AI-2E family transporter [Gammaproteobacteria bacterium]